MQVSVEKLSNIERRLTIVVPADQVEEAYSSQLVKLSQSSKTKLNGFRPGKVPLNLIQKLYGEEARKEALGQVIQTAFYEAIKENKLYPVNTPRIEPKSVLANQPLEFVAQFEVLPEIGEIQFSIPAVEKPIVAISEEDVTSVIKQLQKQYGKWRVVERAAQEKDRVVIDYYSIFNGEADTQNKIENFPLELGSKFMLPGFEAGLIGAKAGDEKTLSLTFPADFHQAEKAGKPVDFKVTVKQVFEADIPELNADFVQQLGVASGLENDLRAQIQSSLESERDRLVNEKIKEQVFQELLKQNKIEIPPSLIEQEAKIIHDKLHPHHHDHHQHSEAELASFNQIAEKRVAIGLLIAAHAKQKDIKVDQEKVGKRIMQIAAVYEHPQEVVQWLSAPERRHEIETQVLEDQILDALLQDVTINEKIMTYAELKGIRI